MLAVSWKLLYHAKLSTTASADLSKQAIDKAQQSGAIYR
jgi:hypothetical protein